MRPGLALLLRRPSFRRLWAAELVSQAGDWFSIVAVSVVSLASPGGGVLALATSLAAHLLPQAFAAPLGGYLADRFDKRTVLLGGALLEGALTIAMVIAAARGDILALQIFVSLRSIASSAREPASGAALPRLVAPDELADANALSAFTWSIAFAAGMSLGGLATAWGAPLALAADAATFLVAAAILRNLPALPPLAGRDAATPHLGSNDTIAVLRRALSPELRGSIFGLSPVAFAGGSAWISLNLAGHALPVAVGAATTVGFLQAVRGAGTAIGPLATRWLGARGDTAFVATLAVLAGTVGLAWAPTIVLATLSSLVWGAGAGALWMIMTTEIQQRSEDGERGRLIALSGLGFTTLMTAGALLTAALADAGSSPASTSIPIAVAAGLGFVALRYRAVGARLRTA